MDLVKKAVSLAADPAQTRWIAPCLILAETVLCALIVWKVSYTEIDYTTYLAQVRLFLNGERRYDHITGPTGPLVYPAIHVYIYTGLYYLTTTGENRLEVDIRLAQLVFGGLYLLTLALVIACYRRVNAPPWLLVPLVLSKRLHSIFLLRLFNDCWATFAFWLTVYALQRRKWTLAAVVWTIGLGVKMTLLITAPALAIILIQGAGVTNAVMLGCLAATIQLTTAVPFLSKETGWQYVSRAFDLGRQFLFKWTVNWRFVGEETFLSKEFAVSLLILHASLLLIFAQTKWVRISSSGVVDFVQKYPMTLRNEHQLTVSKRVTPVFVMDSMLASTAIGLLCARSLHYQFYAYLGWATPYLLWRAGMGSISVMVNWAWQEYSWLVFPSTNSSSVMVVLELALQTFSILIAPPVDHTVPPPDMKDRPQVG